MEDIILETENLCKQYGRFCALENVSVTLQRGHIYGFIGENGAGKSTLMKILTGLCFPTSGSVTILGESDQRGLARVRGRIGSMIEAPAFHPAYTVYENVNVQRILYKNPDQKICDDALSLTGLSDVRDKKAKKLSMGMRQRLGLALALVMKPQLLILDEPCNGFDPQNNARFRELVKRLHEENGLTFFISSHILSELYLLATDYIIIHKGRIVKTLSHEELEAQCRRCLRIKMTDPPKGVTVLERELGTRNFKVAADNTVYLYSHLNDTETVARVLSENHVLVTELSPSEDTLEDYFFSVIKGGEANGQSTEN